MSSLTGGGESSFAPLSGEDNEDYAQFNDIEVNGNIYLKAYGDTLTGYNVPLITSDKTTDDLIFNTTSLNSNFNFTVGTDQDNKETIFAINPTTGLGFNVHTNEFDIGWDELSYLNGARSNLQQQIDALSPDLSNNIGYWGTFWNNNDITATTANTAYLIPYTNNDTSNNGVVYNNSTRIQVLNQGVYMFLLTAQMKHTNSAVAMFHFWLKKNGTNVADSGFKEEIKQTTKLFVANWELRLEANDYIEIAWDTNDTTVTIEHFAASGNVPQIPSVVLTASQITYFQDNTSSITDILQRITGINYTSTNDTTIITNDLSANNFLTDKIKATDISGVILDISNTLIANANTGVILLHASAYLDIESQIYAHGTYITPESLSYVSGATSNIQSQLNSLTLQTIGISYNSPTDTTTIDNNVVISNNKTLTISNINGNPVPLNSYIDQQVNIAYNQANTGINLANQAQSTANDALSTANNANTTANNANATANGALSLASGASAAVAALSAVVAQNSTDIAGLAAGLAATDSAVGVLEVKTQNLEAVPSISTFTGQIITGDTTINPLSILTPTLDAETSIITPVISSNTGTITLTPAVQNLNGTTVNIGASASAVNIGTDGVSSITIGSLNTALTTYICGFPYNPFFPTGFSAQW